jgi:hypothetical protein
MHGILVGAVFGTSVLACVGVWRGVQTWRNSTRRPPLWMICIQVGVQAAIAIAAFIFGVWFLLAGE